MVPVDTGSTDAGPELLARLGPVLHLPRGTTYAAAVRAALSRGDEPTPFVWLLHDDAVPDPDALERLLAVAAERPDAALLGPAVRDAADPRRLVELGTSTSRDGRRDPGVEPGEVDQGQHTAPRAVLAVGTAGALVRREVLDAVGGLDADLPLREDLDLGWRLNAAGSAVLAVPTARVRHGRALTTGERSLEAGRTARVDRRAAVRVLVTCAPPLVLLALLPRLLVGGLLRALLALLVRRPDEALDELAGLGVLGRPDRWVHARRARSATRTAPWSAVRPLLAPALGRRPPRRRSRLPAVPRRSPAVLLVLALALVAVLAARDLVGGGPLAGGDLLPSPPRALDLWSAWLSGGEPALLPRALLGTVPLGAAPLSVDLLLLGAVPLAAAGAWPVARRLAGSTALRLWATATWALLAAVPAAGGRTGGVAVHLALPALLLAGARLARARAHAAWAVALAVTLLAATAPLLWPLAAVLTLLAARRRALPVVVLPAVLVVPQLLTDLLPTGPADPLSPERLLLLEAPLLGLPLLLLALLALTRPDRVRRTAAGWGLALLGLAGALLADRLGADPWPGLALAGAGLLLAAVTGARDLTAALGRSSLGVRQAAVALLAVVAVAGPATAALELVRDGLDGPLRRGGPVLLPAFATAQLDAQHRTALLLTARSDGTLAAALVGATGPRADRPAGDAPRELVTDLLAGTTPTAASALADRGVRFLVLRGEAQGAARALDGAAGLDRRPAAPTPLWEVAAPGRPAPQEQPSRWPALLTAAVLLVAAVLAGPGRPPKRGLVRP